MADTKITDLTAITSGLLATDLLAVVDESDTSMAASGTDKKLQCGHLWQGLLEYTAIDTDDSPYTPNEGELVYVDLSAGVAGGSVTVNTPTASAGDVFGVKLETASGTNTVTISGTTAGDLDSKLYVASDTYIYQYDGTTWHVIAHVITPHHCILRATADQTLTAGSWEDAVLATSDKDVGGIGDVANNKATILRANAYQLYGQGSLRSVADQNDFDAAFWTDTGGGKTQRRHHRTFASGAGLLAQTIASELDLSASEDVFLRLQNNDSVNRDTGTELGEAFASIFALREILNFSA